MAFENDEIIFVIIVEVNNNCNIIYTNVTVHIPTHFWFITKDIFFDNERESKADDLGEMN